MEITLTIPGSIRIKKNSRRIYGFGKFKKVLPSKAYCAWEKAARLKIWGSGEAIVPPLTCPVHVEAHFYYKGPQCDLSGALESVADMLEGLLYLDDKQIVSWDGSRLHHDLKSPRTELIVRWADGDEVLDNGVLWQRKRNLVCEDL